MKHILSVMTSKLLGKSLIRWRQRPDMTVAVDWDVKHQFKQTNKTSPSLELVGEFQLNLVCDNWILAYHTSYKNDLGLTLTYSLASSNMVTKFF